MNPNFPTHLLSFSNKKIKKMRSDAGDVHIVRGFAIASTMGTGRQDFGHREFFAGSSSDHFHLNNLPAGAYWSCNGGVKCVSGGFTFFERPTYVGRNGVSFFTITCWQTAQKGRLMFRMRQSNSGR